MARMVRTASFKGCPSYGQARAGGIAPGCGLRVQAARVRQFSWGSALPVHGVLPAPGQVQRALGARVDGVDDLAVLAEILDGAGDLDV
jgi:hypothetical protein